MKISKKIIIMAVLIFMLCIAPFGFLVMRRINHDIDYLRNYDENRFEREYRNIVNQFDQNLSDAEMQRIIDSLIEEYWSVDDSDITFDINDLSDVKNMTYRPTDGKELYYFETKINLYYLALSLHEESPSEDFRNFHQKLEKSDKPIDRAVIFIMADEHREIAAREKAREFVEEIKTLHFSEKHSTIIEKLERYDSLSRQKLIQVINLANELTDSYKKVPEAKNELLNVLEKMVLKLDSFEDVPFNILMVIDIHRKLAPIERTYYFIENILDRDMTNLRRGVYLGIEGRFNMIEALYKREKNSIYRRKRDEAKAKEIAEKMGIKGEVDKIWVAVIDGLSDVQTPDSDVNNMLTIVSILLFRTETEPAIIEEIKSQIERQLLRYDERDLEPDRFLSLYRSRLASQSETIKMAERVIEERAKDGKESPELEEWIRERRERQQRWREERTN